MNLRIIAVSLMAVLFGLTALSMWPDRRFAPPLPYRPALYAGWPTIEHCETPPSIVRLPGEAPPALVRFCSDLLDAHNGTLDLDLDADERVDHRVVHEGIGHVRAFTVGSGLPVPVIDEGALLEMMSDRINPRRR